MDEQGRAVSSPCATCGDALDNWESNEAAPEAPVLHIVPDPDPVEAALRQPSAVEAVLAKREQLMRRVRHIDEMLQTQGYPTAQLPEQITERPQMPDEACEASMPQDPALQYPFDTSISPELAGLLLGRMDPTKAEMLWLPVESNGDPNSMSNCQFIRGEGRLENGTIVSGTIMRVQTFLPESALRILKPQRKIAASPDGSLPPAEPLPNFKARFLFPILGLVMVKQSAINAGAVVSQLLGSLARNRQAVDVEGGLPDPEASEPDPAA
jgi:hypothetical protein